MRIRTVDISDDVAEVLRRGDWAGNTFQLEKGQLDRKLYEATDKVLRALGGRWKRQFGGHVFEDDRRAELAAALESGSIVDQKKTLEQFFTPADVAGLMHAWLDIRAGMHVLEPSAGNGRLVWEALERGAIVTAIEIDPALSVPLCAEFQKRGARGDVVCTDFMNWDTPILIPIERAAMNPPFSGNQDIAHVVRAFGMLAPGGKLAAVMSPHFTFAKDELSKAFRELLGYPEDTGMGASDGEYVNIFNSAATASISRVAEARVELLPAGTFKAEGTNVRAVLVLIEKAG